MQYTWRALIAISCCCLATASIAQTAINVELKGVDDTLQQNIRLYLSLEQQKGHVLMSEARIRRLHRKAPDEIRRAIQPYGYYRPVVDSQISRIAENQWQLTYSIETGPAIPVGKMEFSVTGDMQHDPAYQSLQQGFRLKPGEAFSHIEYENTKSGLAKLASEHGYFDARFIQNLVEIDLDNYEARIYLHYDSGPRYLFGTVNIEQDIIDDELLRRYIPFEIGSPYTLNELIELQQALNDSDYFQNVEVTPSYPDPVSREISINAVLTPRKRHRYTFGLGFGTDTGARTKLGWEMPRVNTAGHRVSSEVKLSEIGYSFSTSYRVPILNPRTDQMVYSAAVIHEETDVSESTLRTIGASLNRGRGAWRESISLNYQQEDFIIAGSEGDSVLLIPGVSWSRIWGDDFINTFDGLRFDILLRGATEKIVSDTDFSQAQAGIKAINSIDRRNRIITRGRLGSTWTNAFERLPSSVRFFAGGAQSVRGYSYQSLGPRDADGNVIGGKHLMVGSIEFEHSFRNNWGLAIFYDAGNAIDDFSDDLERGAGFGFRWKSPIGPVRIDLASAVSRDGNPWRLHINIGPDL